MKENVVRATHALIHTDALKSNLKIIRGALPSGTAICAAVKANAYGHGSVPISRILREEGVEVLGVSSSFEGKELRDSGDNGRILLLGPAVSQELSLAIRSELELMVTDLDYLNSLINALKMFSESVVPIHIKVDTGMGRVGCSPEEAMILSGKIVEHPSLKLTGLATHYPVADSSLSEDRGFTREQTRMLLSLADDIQEKGGGSVVLHAANSGCIALSPDLCEGMGMARPGISLYGYGEPFGGGVLQPVMELRTRVTSLRAIRAGQTVSYGRTWTAQEDGWIAVIPVGYGDGFPRALSNRADVLIRGKRYPIAGVVCMDQTMVNVGQAENVSLNDDVILFGPDSAGLTAAQIAKISNTIPYEITCGITTRVPRIYI